MIFDLVHALQGLGEKVSQKVIIRGLFEGQLSNIVKIDPEFLYINRANSRKDTSVLVSNRYKKPALEQDAEQSILQLIISKRYIASNIPGNPSHSSLIGVDCFFSPIFSYFCLLVAAFNPCQGRPPLRKYMKTCPIASKSSRRDCSNEHKVTIGDCDCQEIDLIRSTRDTATAM